MGLERLAQQLLDDGTIDRRQLEEARRTQSFFGGPLATHLLQMGLVDETTLGQALTAVTGAPYASRDQLLAPDPETLNLVSEALAERFRVCPFELEDPILRVAMLNPRDAIAIADIQRATGYRVEPWVTCEYRLYQALQRHYRIEPQERRGISLAPPRVLPDTPRMPREPDASPGGSDGSTAEIGLDGRPLDAEVSFEEFFGHPAPPSPAPGKGSEDASAPVAIADAPADRARRSEIEKLEAVLAAAFDRDETSEALLDFCATRVRRAALFGVTRVGIRGIAGRGDGLESERLRALEIPVEPASIFDTALGDRGFFFGAVPPLPANQDLYSALGGRLPAMAMIVPIRVKGKIAAVLYLDNGDRPIERPDLPLMGRVAAKAGLAFEILLLRRKLRDL